MLKVPKNILRFRVANYAVCNKRNKYIVLLPEVPADTADTNPLLRSEGLPAFGQLSPDQCVNAVGKLIIEYESGVHQLDQKIEEGGVESTVQNVLLPLERLSGPLDFAWGTFKLLHTVRRNTRFGETYIKLHPRLIRAKQEKFLSSSIYKAFKEMQQGEVTGTVRRIVDKHLLESELCGTHLSDKHYAHYQSIMKSLNSFCNNFDARLRKSTSLFAHQLGPKDVRNFPFDLLRLLAEDPSNPSAGPWVLRLSPLAYHSFLEHCDDRMLRWNAWNAYNTRASASSDTNLNNSIPLEEIRHQRAELAKLMGYNSFAEMTMRTKMAGSVDNVMEMITTLRVKSRDAMLSELEALRAFASSSGHHHTLEPWDIPYWQRLHKEHLFNIDDDVVRHHFPYPKVLQGVFDLCHKLFNVTIKEKTGETDVWHTDVKLYSIEDESGKEVALFYLDPYYRSGKLPGAWLEVGRNRSDVIGSQPLSYLVFNFHAPEFGEPCLLSFQDVKTMLEKLGHLLQHSLTSVPYAEVSGLSNLEWDVVDVCPRVMASLLHQHPNPLAPDMPADLHAALVKRDKYMHGLKLSEDLFYSALDLELYSGKEFWASACKRLWGEYLPFEWERNFARPCSLSEIFTGQYPAAYFSHTWAEMIAADVFSAFEEAGLDNEKNLKVISQRFRDTFLALGGGCHPSEVFRKFRGRDPSTDALLANYGFVQTQ